MKGFNLLDAAIQCRNKMTPDKMIERILAGDDLECSQELVSALFNGYPVENILPLLRSDLHEAQDLGVYLVYELDTRARPIMDDVVPFLDHESPQYRASVILVLTQCATEFEPEPLGRIIAKLADPDVFVQRAAIRFVMESTGRQLIAGVKAAARALPATEFARLPKILGRTLYCNTNVDLRALKAARATGGLATRNFVVGLAARPQKRVFEQRLALAGATASNDFRKYLEHYRASEASAFGIVPAQ